MKRAAEIENVATSKKGCPMNNSSRIAAVCAAMLLALSISRAQPGGTQYTLTSGTDYTHYTAGPVGCPQCKDGFYTTKPISSPAGTKITSIRVTSRTPTTNNHWYRCQVEVNCGMEEFSDVNVHNKSCLGTSSCLVWRATDGSNGNEQDVIDVQWQ